MAGIRREPTTPSPARSNPMERTYAAPAASGPAIPSKPGVNGKDTDFYKTFPAMLDEKEKVDLQQKLAQIGAYNGIKKPWIKTFWNPEVDGVAFKKVVDLAVANGFVDPVTKYPNYQTIIDLAKADPKSYGTLFATNSTGGYQGPTTSISKSDVKYDSQKLKDTVNAAYMNAVGREATAEEITKAVQAVNAGNQTTTTTTVSKNKKGQTVTSQVTIPGVDAGQLITDQAKSTPEYGSYQSATTYFDAMLDALGSPMGRGY